MTHPTYTSEERTAPPTETPCAAARARPTLTLEPEKFAHLLDDPNLSEDQKHQFLEALWTIIVAFVDLGYGIHPLQETYEDSCGQKPESSCEAPGDLAAVLDSPTDKHEGGNA